MQSSNKNIAKKHSQVDQLAIMLSEQISKESGRTASDVLWEIVDTAKDLSKNSQKKSAASSAKRSGLRPSKEAHTCATSKA